jgi:AcrR family transcriptional regulator
MPRVTDEHREARRAQILEAARACLEEHGLESVSMEMIIARSGLSTGAVYGYFKGKDEIINAAVTEGTAELGRYLVPLLTMPEPPPLPELLGRVLDVIADFGQRKPGVDLLVVAVHGWSHSQSNPELKSAVRASYGRLRDLFAQTVRRWQAAGTFDPDADAGAMAELFTSVCLGFLAQRVLAGDASVPSHAAALATLTAAPQPLCSSAWTHPRVTASSALSGRWTSCSGSSASIRRWPWRRMCCRRRSMTPSAGASWSRPSTSTAR